MAVGDVHYANGKPYVETLAGPMIEFPCEDCGGHAAAAIDYRGRVRCGPCWERVHWPEGRT